jgi:hypothetical protein
LTIFDKGAQKRNFVVYGFTEQKLPENKEKVPKPYDFGTFYHLVGEDGFEPSKR